MTTNGPTRMPGVLLLLFLLALAAPAAAQDWPSPAQVEAVRARRQGFPVAHLVSDVDWYAPLETVRGVGRPKPLPLRKTPTIAAAALANAQAYADAQKSYALLVWHDGALDLEHYAPGFARGDRFDTASMHKTVLALALGIAVADGKIASVDDPLSRYLPELAGTRRGALPLTAYLEMASGIETADSSAGDGGAYWQYAFGDDLHAAVAHWPDTCVAQSEFCYANANTQLLGWALQAATGQRYADWLGQRLWRPIGAGDARVWLDHPGGSPRFSCCLQATAQDWLRVGLLLLGNGRVGGKVGGKQIVPADWIAHMEAPSAANPNYGWQLWRGSPHNPRRTYGKRLRAVVAAAEPFARDDVYYLDGSAGQRVYVVPSAGLVIVRIGTPSMDWDDSKLPNLVLAGIK